MNCLKHSSAWTEVSVLLTANTLSMISNSLSTIAIPWFVFELTGSAIATAGIVLAGQLPNLVVGLISGPFIDRFSARTVSLFSDAVNFLAILLIPLLFSLNVLDMVMLGFLVFLSQVIDVPGYTARNVIISSLIDQNRLPREKVNGLASLVETGADLIGPIIAGVLISLISAVFVLVLDSITFALSFVLILLGVQSKKTVDNKTSNEPVRATWRWMLGQETILRLGLFDLLINTVATSLLVLTLPVVAKSIQDEAIWLGVWLACFAIGTTLTTAAYTFAGHKFSSIQLLRFTPIGQAIGLGIIAVTIGLSLSGVLVAVGLFIYGLNLGVGSVVDATVLQKIVPEHRRGTVFSAFSSIRYVGVPFGLLMSGIILDFQAFAFLFAVFAMISGATSLL